TDEIVRPAHTLQGPDAFPEDALDKQKLLDRLRAALPASEGDETVPALKKIDDCKLQLAGHTLFDAIGPEVRLARPQTALRAASARRDRAADRLRRQSSPGTVA